MLETLTCHVRSWLSRRTAIRELRWMDDRLLRDIGAKRGAIPQFVEARAQDEDAGQCG